MIDRYIRTVILGLAATVAISTSLISSLSAASEVVRTATPIADDQVIHGSAYFHPILPAE
jgi:hypothetical protein